jgi:5-methylcytosine-specific restriction endonuclease McrA
MRLCTAPGCTEPAGTGDRCPEHNRERNRRYMSANKPIYNSRRWKFTRRKQLHLEPLCAVCGDLAEDVHHKTDIQDGGDMWALENLESLCHRDHSQITREEQLRDTGHDASGARSNYRRVKAASQWSFASLR